MADYKTLTQRHSYKAPIHKETLRIALLERVLGIQASNYKKNN